MPTYTNLRVYALVPGPYLETLHSIQAITINPNNKGGPDNKGSIEAILYPGKSLYTRTDIANLTVEVLDTDGKRIESVYIKNIKFISVMQNVGTDDVLGQEIISFTADTVDVVLRRKLKKPSKKKASAPPHPEGT